MFSRALLQSGRDDANSLSRPQSSESVGAGGELSPRSAAAQRVLDDADMLDYLHRNGSWDPSK